MKNLFLSFTTGPMDVCIKNYESQTHRSEVNPCAHSFISLFS